MFKLKKSVSVFSKLKTARANILQDVSDKFTRFEKKVEGTMAENWVRYWKNVVKDYKDVAVDVIQDIKEKPTKATLIGSSFMLTAYFAKHNPNANDFRDAYIKAANEMALVHHTLVRDESKEHLKYIDRCYNSEIIRHTSLGLFSIVWIDNYSKKCNKFETQCSYLQLGYSEILSRVIDIGFVDTWWILAKKMTDYDINF